MSAREPSPPPIQISLQELVSLWWKVGWLGFGGPAGQIALMHRLLVDEKKWLSEEQYLHALSFCMLLPGPEAQQLATYSGWLLRGWRGGLIAGGLFILPGFCVMVTLSLAYFLLSSDSWFVAIFFGIKAAVLVVVIEALIKIAKRAFKSRTDYFVAATAFLALFVFSVPFPAVVAAAAMFGFLRHRKTPPNPDPVTGPRANTCISVIIWACVWAVPFICILAMAGPQSPFMNIALFFSQMALVTFGGAYAVLAYVAQQAVESYQWLTPDQMVDGLALAETTPGPLVLVLTYVGFLAGTHSPLWGQPLLGGLLGAVISTWVTFAPCFLWVFAGAPYIERLRHNKRLSAALATITAAVVGVILNLALWFALHVMFAKLGTFRLGPISLLVPDPVSFNAGALLIAVVAGVMLLWRRWNLVVVLLLAALAGIILSTVAPGLAVLPQ